MENGWVRPREDVGGKMSKFKKIGRIFVPIRIFDKFKDTIHMSRKMIWGKPTNSKKQLVLAIPLWPADVLVLK